MSDERRALTDGETSEELQRAARRSTTGGDLELTRRNRWPIGSRGPAASKPKVGWRGKVLSTIVAAGMVYVVFALSPATSISVNGEAVRLFTEAQAQNFAVFVAILMGFVHVLGWLAGEPRPRY